jgi:hypothetical protein
VESWIECPECQQRFAYRFSPLLLVSGPSGSGKSAIYERLVGRVSECLMVEYDALLMKGIDLSDEWRYFRDIWLRLAHSLAQDGKPVVLFGANPPHGWDDLPQRCWVGPMHHLALVCDRDTLKARLAARPAWRGCDEAFIAEMLKYNAWLQTEASSEVPGLELLDTSKQGIAETEDAVRSWIVRQVQAVASQA